MSRVIHSIKSPTDEFDLIKRGIKTFCLVPAALLAKSDDMINLLEVDDGKDPRCPRCQYLLADESCSCVAPRFTGNNLTLMVTHTESWLHTQGGSRSILSIKIIEP